MQPGMLTVEKKGKKDVFSGRLVVHVKPGMLTVEKRRTSSWDALDLSCEQACQCRVETGSSDSCRRNIPINNLQPPAFGIVVTPGALCCRRR